MDSMLRGPVAAIALGFQKVWFTVQPEQRESDRKSTAAGKK